MNENEIVKYEGAVDTNSPRNHDMGFWVSNSENNISRSDNDNKSDDD